MIYVNVPFSPKDTGKDLGYAYNKFCESLPNNNDWACFLDHDAMFTTSTWYHQLEDIIDKHNNRGVFGARTNRINSTYQLVGNIDVYNHDIMYHREIGKHLQKKYYSDTLRITDDTAQRGFSGIVILIKKSTWKKIGGFISGFNDVDNNLRYSLEKHNIPMYIMNGVYAYHWYKADQPYDRCYDKFKTIDNHYKLNNMQNFDIQNVFLYNGTAEELPI